MSGQSSSADTDAPSSDGGSELDQFRGGLLDWGADVRRDLPWRATRDGWAILVSEVMLQQTQVSRVEPMWIRFLERFPTATACAEAPLADVLTLWQGLGYPRRARNLHRCAAALVDAHRGEMPTELEVLLALPGIGPYTARAVLAFAHEVDVAIVDTNVGRVLARHTGNRLTAKAAQHEADRLSMPGRSWDWNQSMLDLGAMVCRPKDPDCEQCPVAEGCEWRRTGCAAPDPAARSAGVSRPQPRFEGSNRQSRGRVMRALVEGPVEVRDLAGVIGNGCDDASAAEVVASLIDDGLARFVGDTIALP